MKCLIIDVVSPAIKAELSKYMTVDEKILPTQDELIQIIPDYDVLVMRVDPKISEAVIDAGKNLKVIAVCSVGLNHVAVDYAKAKGIQLFNAPGMNANAVAELTISKMLDLARGTMTANSDVQIKKQWDKYKFMGHELRGQTVGIMGFGRIGRRVGELARAFKMNVVAYDPFLKPEDFEKEGAVGMDIPELLKVADFVTLHVPLTEQTKNLISKDTIPMMKDNCIVLNMSRGGICNEADIQEALEAGTIGGYGADVMENELAGSGLTADAGFDSPLFGNEKFIVSPHIGAQSVEAANDIGELIIARVKEALNLQ